MTGPLYHIGRFCTRHHWQVLVAWVVAVGALVAISHTLSEKTSDNLNLPGTGSTQATDRLQDKLPDQAYGSNPLVMKTETGKLTDAKNKTAVDDTVAALQKTPHVIKVVNPLSSEGSAFLSRGKTEGYIPVTLGVGQGDLTKGEAQAVLDAAQPARNAGMKTAVGGYVGKALSKPSTEVSEAIGLGAAVIILLFAFGTATAMALPIITAVVGLASTLAVIRLVEQVAQVPSVSSTLATMIGLGVGIDYALFIVTRHKLQIRDGMDVRESTARAAATAGGAVVFAGCTVVIALCSLYFAGIPLVTTLGYTAAIAVVVAVLAATTLLPALLGALGARIDSLRVKVTRTHPDDHQPHGWTRWARGVAARPWRSAIASVAILLVLAIPVLQLTLGQSDVGALPKSTTARQAYDLMREGFGVGTNGPLLVAVKLGSKATPDQKNLNQINKQEQQLQQQQNQIVQQGLAAGLTQQQAQQQAQQKTKSQSDELATKKKQAESPATDPRLATLQKDMAKTQDVQTVSPPTLNKVGDTAVYTVVAKSAPSSQETEDLVNNLRDNVLPHALKGTNLTASVGGQTASYIDLAKRISDKLPSIILIVVGLSCVVLLLAFRSVVVPIKAAVMNLLSVAAAYGVLTFVFQEGHGAKLVGLEGAIPIVSFVPLLMFAILFGLSMDYEVFLMTQIQEHYHDHHRPVRAVVEGLANTGRVITSAALIMVCVFTSFVLNGDPIVKEFGVGLAVAIAIDATVVRCLLVPAVMTLLGKHAWWMPRWLGRVTPRIEIEGAGYFADRDAKTLAPASPVPDAEAAPVEKTPETVG
ncbi:MAG: MMPL family transporter [Thermoleophilaceae bacterium]